MTTGDDFTKFYIIHIIEFYLIPTYKFYLKWRFFPTRGKKILNEVTKSCIEFPYFFQKVHKNRNEIKLYFKLNNIK